MGGFRKQNFFTVLARFTLFEWLWSKDWNHELARCQTYKL